MFKLIIFFLTALIFFGCSDNPIYKSNNLSKNEKISCFEIEAIDSEDLKIAKDFFQSQIKIKKDCPFLLSVLRDTPHKCFNPRVKSTGSDIDNFSRELSHEMPLSLFLKSLNAEVVEEFKDDLKKWGAEITKDNIFRFNSPEVLFKTGSSKISREFRAILNDFFPRYIHLLTSKRYINEIDEIRIEGHTTNDWGRRKSSKNMIYLKNMKLSQNRANNVLAYCYRIKTTHKEWTRLTAVVQAPYVPPN